MKYGASTFSSLYSPNWNFPKMTVPLCFLRFRAFLLFIFFLLYCLFVFFSFSFFGNFLRIFFRVSLFSESVEPLQRTSRETKLFCNFRPIVFFNRWTLDTNRGPVDGYWMTSFLLCLSLHTWLFRLKESFRNTILKGNLSEILWRIECFIFIQEAILDLFKKICNFTFIFLKSLLYMILCKYEYVDIYCLVILFILIYLLLCISDILCSFCT